MNLRGAEGHMHLLSSGMGELRVCTQLGRVKGEGGASAGLMTAFPLVSAAALGSHAFSITGFLIKKFPAKKIKLNRQYKRNQKSIVQLTFLLCVIERPGPASFESRHSHAQSS